MLAGYRPLHPWPWWTVPLSVTRDWGRKVKMDDVVTWIFPANEVEVTAQIIGRGAFGEVRVAKWRSIPVACKRLHAAVESDSHTQEVMDGLNAEMQILSKLRHPNLVLFLGVCVATNDDVNHPHLTSLPTMILTELMPCSLYDILEVHKVPLNLAEILDISLDISYGMRYLHSHVPSIIHRDISAKNILIGGSRAKIADLGQAKIFGTSALSRQTSMPGAMVSHALSLTHYPITSYQTYTVTNPHCYSTSAVLTDGNHNVI